VQVVEKLGVEVADDLDVGEQVLELLQLDRVRVLASDVM
jgi:hypothetical protein